MGSLLAFVSAFSYAAGYILVRTGVRSGDADGGAFVSTIANAVLLAGALLLVALGGHLPPLDPAALAWFAIGGFLGPYLGRSLLFAGIHRLGPVRASAVVNTAPLVTVALAVIVIGEELSWAALAATALVVLGLIILAIEAFELDAPTGAQGVAVIPAPGDASAAVDVGKWDVAAREIRRWTAAGLASPVAVGLVAAGLSAVAFGIARTARRLGMETLPEPLVGAAVGAVAGLVVHLLAQATRGQLRAIVRSTVLDPRPRLWAAGALSAVGLFTFFAALTFAPLAHVAVIAASETLVTLVLGGLFLRDSERLSPRVAIPALCVFGGGLLVALS